MLDLDEDGQPVGCDIQHAPAKRDFIARLILDEQRAATIATAPFLLRGD